MNRAYQRTVLVTSSIAIALGFAILIRTAYEGGGSVGYVLGALFVALGTARIYLYVKQRGS